MQVNAISFYRMGVFFKKMKVPFLPRLMEMLTYIFCNCSIPLSATIGRGSRCGHRGIAVVIHPEAIIGDDCVIGAQVVVGGKGFGIPGAPKIGNRVYMGAGAKILGPVTIGDDAFLGANAVIVDNVPPGAIMVGNPARDISSEKR